jgi:phosphopantetheine adenylyltransferase
MAFLSSTIVKEMARYQVDLHGYVADAITEEVSQRMLRQLG